MCYILFKKLNQKDINDIVAHLEKRGFKNTHLGPSQETAIGICINKILPYDKGDLGSLVYTFLSDAMCGNNLRSSWTAYRRKCETKDEFLANVNKVSFIGAKVFNVVCDSAYDYEGSVSVHTFATKEKAQAFMKECYDNERDEWEDDFTDSDGEINFDCGISENGAYYNETGDYTRNHVAWEIIETEIE